MEANTAAINICKPKDVSVFLSRIDPADSDAAFRMDVGENIEELHTVCSGDTVVGLALIDDDTKGYLYLYIFPEYRRKGYGTLAAHAAQQQIQASPLVSLTTVYGSNNPAAERFAEKCGFAKKYSSALMTYPGTPFEDKALPVRQYRDEDFDDAFALSSEAFHLMRLSTGCFPDSVINTPDGKTRQLWAETAEERYVYVLNGEVIGYARIDGAELDTVAIKPARQGQGLGREFVKYLTNIILKQEDEAPFLYCVVGNRKARQLYDSLGYREVTCNTYAVKKFEH